MSFAWPTLPPSIDIPDDLWRILYNFEPKRIARAPVLSQSLYIPKDCYNYALEHDYFKQPQDILKEIFIKHWGYLEHTEHAGFVFGFVYGEDEKDINDE